jgi:hypothetical protein
MNLVLNDESNLITSKFNTIKRGDTMTEQNEKVNAEQSQEEQVRTEEYVFSGDEVIAKIKELLHEGNVRRMTIYSDSGTVLLDVPLTIGLAGTAAAVVLAPVLTTITMLAGVLLKIKVKVERIEEELDETE